MVTEKRACLGKCIKNAYIQKQVPLVGINTDWRILTGIGIMDQKTEVPPILFDGVDQPEIFAAFSALKTIEDQGGSPLMNGQDHEYQFKSDQKDDDPFKEIGVLDTHLVREHRVILLNHLDLAADTLAPLAAPEYF
jgi:hypothetical protein